MAEVVTGRINYIKNPSFEDGTTRFWANTESGILDTATTQQHVGTTSLQVYKVTNTVNCGATIDEYRIPVTEGLDYTFSAYVKLPGEAPTRTFTVQIDWYDAESGGNAVGTAATASFEITGFQIDPTFIPFQACHVTAEAPEDATYAVVSIYQEEAEDFTANPQQYYTFFYVDAVMFEQSSYLNGFFETLPQAVENARVETGMRPVPYPKITGLELNADINFNGLILNTIDEDGIVWICADLEGWWGHPDPDIPNIPRGQGDGSYDVRGRYASRDITLVGAFFPPSKEYVTIARDKLVRAMDLVKTGGWLIADEEPSKAAYVRMSGRPQILTVNARGRTEFRIGLRASDPIKYEWTYGITEDGRKEVGVAVNDNQQIINAGNTPVPAVFELRGPLSIGSSIENYTSEKSITLNQNLRGDTRTVNVTFVSRSANVAKIETDLNPNLFVGDVITVANVTEDSGEFNGTDLVVTEVDLNDEIPLYEIYYLNPGSDFNRNAAAGELSLTTEDVLIIDTYNQEVSFNGNTQGYRFYLDPLIDWIYLEPGGNDISLIDEAYTATITHVTRASNVATIETSTDLDLLVGDLVTIQNLTNDSDSFEGANLIVTRVATNEFDYASEGSDVTREEATGDDPSATKSEIPSLTVKYRSGWIG